MSKLTVGNIVKKSECISKHSTLRLDVGENEIHCDDTFIIRNSVKDQKKTNKDLQRSSAGVNVSF